MIGRRTEPLFLILFLGGLLCLLRLYQVQITEHEVWAGEAAKLVSFGRLLPYQRGNITDTNGVVMAKDKETHELVLIYRDFRRGHPVGQVAHARSLLEGRAVSLEEAHADLYYWARELMLLTPGSLEAFSKGEALQTESLLVSSASETERSGRARRAADVRFYLRRLFDLTPRQWAGVLKDLTAEQEDLSFLTLVAKRRGGEENSESVWAEIEHRLAQAEDHFQRLARRLSWPKHQNARVEALPALERLIFELEESRRWVEDASAAKLFAEAAGFTPGRLDPITLRAYIDLEWVRILFAWDDRRLDEWVATTRKSWMESWRNGYALPHLVASMRLDRDTQPDDFINHIASLFLAGDGLERALDGELPDWQTVDTLAVFSELDRVFELREPELVAKYQGSAVPFLQRELRQLEVRPEFRWNLLDAALADPPQVATLGDRVRRYLRAARYKAEEELYASARLLADDWERAFQSTVKRLLLELQRRADEDELSPQGRLRFARERRERAVERADYFLKDYGYRPRSLVNGEPEYDVIYLLSRYEKFYPGFEVREARERVYPLGLEDKARPAAKLLGHVSSISAFDMQSQRAQLQRLRELRDVRRRSDEEETELVQLVGRVLQHDEVKGVSGLEGLLDPDLVGRNGYFETLGLDDLASDRRSFLSESEDGLDVALTLDLTVQRAAERTLANPEVVATDEKFDYAWAQSPVGAIVMITVGGDIIAAASEPNEASIGTEGDPTQRGVIIDRTLRMPDFQPPGSVFKPFVAAYALDRAGLDPNMKVLCGPIAGRPGAGYADMRCHSFGGHGEVDLKRAIAVSCNAYFARLGELLSVSDFRTMALAFGFGQYTGVRQSPFEGDLRSRFGLAEDVGKNLFQEHLGDFERRRAANGLSVVEATPMQVARAAAGLATGKLPSMRFVRAVGGADIPQRTPQPLPFGFDALEFVRSAMFDVTNSHQGSASRALSVSQLGFEVVAKTGSADIETASTDDDPRNRVVRKHTWVAGWAPAENPVMVFVVFLHDTQSTSSHGAIYLARQFLTQPEVGTWLQNNGVALAEERASRPSEEQSR